jgi:protein SCO1/2
MGAFRTLLAAAALALVAGCAPEAPSFKGADVTGASFGRDFALTGHDGKPRTLADFRGKAVVVFFGFTQCPDVCPTTLATVSQALRQLQDLPADLRPRVLLVSVDPERDTPEILAPYVRFFDPQFLGATGSLEATAAAAAAFSVPYAKVSLPEGGYTLDHGSGLFVVGPSGMLVAYFSAPHEAATIARDYRAIVEHLETDR